MDDLDQIIKEVFKQFIQVCQRKYHLGDAAFFFPADGYEDQHCINPYLKTEADVQVKFGGLLE